MYNIYLFIASTIAIATFKNIIVYFPHIVQPYTEPQIAPYGRFICE